MARVNKRGLWENDAGNQIISVISPSGVALIWNEQLETSPGTDESWDGSVVDGDNDLLPDSRPHANSSRWGSECLIARLDNADVSVDDESRYYEDHNQTTEQYIKVEVILDDWTNGDDNEEAIFHKLYTDGGLTCADLRWLNTAYGYSIKCVWHNGSDWYNDTYTTTIDTQYRVEYWYKPGASPGFGWRVNGVMQYSGAGENCSTSTRQLQRTYVGAKYTVGATAGDQITIYLDNVKNGIKGRIDEG